MIGKPAPSDVLDPPWTPVQPVSQTFSLAICQRISSSIDDIQSKESRLELDSHADSPVLGRGAHITYNTGRTVSVRGFTDELGDPIRVPVVNGVLVYECEHSGNSYALHLRNCLHIPSMSNHLIPPFMMRLTGLVVNECPKFLSIKPSIADHSIFFP